MQLILTQSDIETALINYVNELVNIKDGMSITVDLKATRGADGATAIIDISPAKTGSAKAEPVVKPAVVTNSKPAQAKAETKAEPKAEVKADPKPEVEPETSTDPVVDPSNTVAETQGQESQSGAGEDAAADSNAAEESAQVADEAGEAEAPATETQGSKPKSLFEGLRKPKND